jgi:hypothetical protein
VDPSALFSTQQRPENFLDHLSNSGPAIRRMRPSDAERDRPGEPAPPGSRNRGPSGWPAPGRLNQSREIIVPAAVAELLNAAGCAPGSALG